MNETPYHGYDFAGRRAEQLRYFRELGEARQLSAQFIERADAATLERVRGEIAVNLWALDNIIKILRRELDALPALTVGEQADTQFNHEAL